MKSAISTARSFLLATVSCAAACLGPGQALAQQADEVAPPDAIVVTGSRIQRAVTDTAQPVSVLSGEELEKRGFINIADALNELPISGIGSNPASQQDGVAIGTNYLNLFGLGSNRTLTLVNGRRFVSSNVSAGSGAPIGGSTIPAAPVAGSQVDLNSIPTSLIARVETVQSGGAAVYGSDAIAGVVNIILADDFSGLRLDGQYGISQRGDAGSFRLGGTGGINFAENRGNVTVAVEYSETDPLLYTDRKVTAAQLRYARNPADTSPTDGIPASILVFNRRVPELTKGGLPFVSYGTSLANILRIPDPSGVGTVAAQFGPDGTLVPYNPGTFYSTSTATGGDGYNLAPVSPLLTAVDRLQFTALAHYDLTDNIRLFAEGFVIRTDATEPANQPIFNSALYGGQNDALLMSVDNPFLSNQARGLLQAQNISSFYLSRASEDIIGSTTSRARNTTYRGVIGLKGEFAALDRDFHWDISFNRGHVSGRDRTPAVIRQRFLNAVDAVAGPGGIPVCRVTLANPGSTNPDVSQCQPLNLFGEGAPSKAAIAYVLTDYGRSFGTDQTDVQANFGGDLVRLPAGSARFNIGYEYRREAFSITPDFASASGILRSPPLLPAAGSYHTNEFYGEVAIPVFGDDLTVPLVRRLELTGAYRRISNSNSGKDESWSLGVEWEPVEGVTLRGTRSRSFRAPAAIELFSPQSEVGTLAVDPCDAGNISGGPNPATRTANCQAAFQALGLPANYQLTSRIQSTILLVTTGGNPGLRNETANSWSAGFVLQPRFAAGLLLRADYMKTDIDDAIYSYNLSSILSNCYDQASAVPACGQFARDASGQIVSGTTGYVNAGYTNFQGVTAGATYGFDVGRLLGGNDAGRLSFNLDYFRLIELETSVSGTGADLNDDLGEIGTPKTQWKLGVDYSVGKFFANWTISYLGKSKFNNSFTVETQDRLAVEGYYLQSLAMGLQINDKLRLRAAVNNLFDVEPPYGTSGERVYDLVGRTFTLGATAKF